MLTRKHIKYDFRTKRCAKNTKHSLSKRRTRNKQSCKNKPGRSLSIVTTQTRGGGGLTKMLFSQFSWLKTKLEQLNRYQKRARNILLKKMQGTHKDRSKRVQFYCPNNLSEIEEIVFSVKHKLLYPLVLKDNDSRIKIRRHIRNGTELRHVLHGLPKKNTLKPAKVHPESLPSQSTIILEHQCENGTTISVNDGVQVKLLEASTLENNTSEKMSRKLCKLNTYHDNTFSFFHSDTLIPKLGSSSRPIAKVFSAKIRDSTDELTFYYDCKSKSILPESLYNKKVDDITHIKLEKELIENLSTKPQNYFRLVKNTSWTVIENNWMDELNNTQLTSETDIEYLVPNQNDIKGFLVSMQLNNKMVQKVTMNVNSKCTVTYEGSSSEEEVVFCSQVTCTVKHLNSLTSVMPLSYISGKISPNVINQSEIQHAHISDKKYELQEWSPPILLGVGHVFSYSGRHIRMDMEFDWKNLFCHFYGITNYLIRFNKDIRRKKLITSSLEDKYRDEPTPICIVVPPKGHNSILSIVKEVVLESTVKHSHRLFLSQNQDVSIMHCRNGPVVSIELFVNSEQDNINEFDSIWELYHRLLPKSLIFDYGAHADIPTYRLFDAISTAIKTHVQDEDDFKIKLDVSKTVDAKTLLQLVSTRFNLQIYVYQCEYERPKYAELEYECIKPNSEAYKKMNGIDKSSYSTPTPIYLAEVQYKNTHFYHRLQCHADYSPSKYTLKSNKQLSSIIPQPYHPLNVLENVIQDNHMWCISYHNILLAYNYLNIEPRTAWWNKTQVSKYATLKNPKSTPDDVNLQFFPSQILDYYTFAKCKYLPFGMIEVEYHKRPTVQQNDNKLVIVVTTKSQNYCPYVPNEAEIKQYNNVYVSESSKEKAIPYGRFKFSDFKSSAVRKIAKTGFAVNGDDGVYASIKLQDNAVVTLCSLGQFRIVTLHPGESRRFDMKYVVAFNENCQLKWMRKYKNNGAQRVSLGIDFLISNVQITNIHPTLDTHVICQTTESPHWGYIKWRLTQALTLGVAGGGLFALGAVPMSLKFIQISTGLSLSV